MAQWQDEDTVEPEVAGGREFDSHLGRNFLFFALPLAFRIHWLAHSL